jgi:hypothetical protein
MIATLNEIEFPDDVIWEDEFDWTPVSQIAKTTLTGSVIIESLYANKSGRPITLDCGWLRREKLLELEALRDAEPEEMTLTLEDERVFSVFWRHDSGKPIEAKAVIPRPKHNNSDYYRVKLFLMEIS